MVGRRNTRSKALSLVRCAACTSTCDCNGLRCEKAAHCGHCRCCRAEKAAARSTAHPCTVSPIIDYIHHQQWPAPPLAVQLKQHHPCHHRHHRAQQRHKRPLHICAGVHTKRGERAAGPCPRLARRYTHNTSARGGSQGTGRAAGSEARSRPTAAVAVGSRRKSLCPSMGHTA